MPGTRLPVVGVLGSGSEPHAEQAEPLGRLVASLGAHLLTGGGGGVMEAVAHGFVTAPGRRGLSLGILPADDAAPGHPPPGYPNACVEVAIRTHLPLRGARGTEPLSRNHLNVLSADALVALPGGPGTQSELRLALRYRRPAVAWSARGAWRDAVPDGIAVAESLTAVEDFLRRALRLR